MVETNLLLEQYGLKNVTLENQSGGGDGLNAVFFVVHPKDWGPYQHRFRESALTGLVNSAIKSGASSAGGMLAGAAVGMFFGPVGAVVGAGVGAIGSTIGSSFAKSVMGDYLRYIG
ncbi:hypothetical protein ABK040_015936 [Willaertia magna]